MKYLEVPQVPAGHCASTRRLVVPDLPVNIADRSEVVDEAGRRVVERKVAADQTRQAEVSRAAEVDRRLVPLVGGRVRAVDDVLVGVCRRRGWWKLTAQRFAGNDAGPAGPFIVIDVASDALGVGGHVNVLPLKT